MVKLFYRWAYTMQLFCIANLYIIEHTEFAYKNIIIKQSLKKYCKDLLEIGVILALI